MYRVYCWSGLSLDLVAPKGAVFLLGKNTLLRVGCCWLKFEHSQISVNFTQPVNCCNCLVRASGPDHTHVFSPIIHTKMTKNADENKMVVLKTLHFYYGWF